MSLYRMPPIRLLFRPPIWPAGPVFLALRPRLCSLSVSGLAVENSARAENSNRDKLRSRSAGDM